jgi:hypothetical protein
MQEDQCGLRRGRLPFALALRLPVGGHEKGTEPRNYGLSRQARRMRLPTRSQTSSPVKPLIPHVRDVLSPYDHDRSVDGQASTLPRREMHQGSHAQAKQDHRPRHRTSRSRLSVSMSPSHDTGLQTRRTRSPSSRQNTLAKVVRSRSSTPGPNPQRP